MKKISRLSKFWLPPVLWGVIIFLFSARPTKTVTEIYWEDFIFKKTIHLIEYGFLFALLYRALKNTIRSQLLKLALYAFLLTVFYGATDEYHQTMTPGRQGLLRDVIIDSFGAGLAWWGLWKWLPKAPKRLRLWAKRLQII